MKKMPHSVTLKCTWFYLFIVFVALLQDAVNRGAWSLNCYYSNVEVFPVLYLRDPEADELHNLISSSLSTDTSAVKLSRRQTDRQTDRDKTQGKTLPLWQK